MDFNQILWDDKDLQVLLVDGPKMCPQIQDGVPPITWKMPYLCNSFNQFRQNFARWCIWGLGTPSIIKIFMNFKILDGRRPPS